MNVSFLCQLLCENELPRSPSAGIWKRASVLMPIFEKNNQAHILAVLKADTEGYPWRNQVALPGGHVDDKDANATAAAYREIEEELNITESQIKMIGSLGYFPTILQVEIEAFVGLWKGGLSMLRFDPQEISATLEVPIDDLIKTHVRQNYLGRLPGVSRLIYPAGSCNNGGDVVIWGVTATIIHFFLEHLRRVAPESFSQV